MECTSALCCKDERLTGDAYKDPDRIVDLVRDALDLRSDSLLQLAAALLKREADAAAAAAGKP